MAEFSYFDQFKEIEIDLTNYLNILSTNNDIYTFTNKQQVKTKIKNLFTRYDIIVEYKDNIDSIIQYQIEDDEYVENIAYKIYGDASFWWVVLIFNDIKDPYIDMPLSQKQIVESAKLLYEKESKFSYNTYVQLIHDMNEEKRNIILPTKSALKDIIWKYREMILQNG